MFEYAHSTGIPDSSCMNYIGRNLMDGDSPCQAIDICRECKGPSPKANETLLENCEAITNYKRFYVTDYYTVKGADQMKSEISQYGPLSCGMYLTPNLISNYTGGIYSEKVDDAESMINHEVSVVGYSVEPETGVEYWIVRNT